MENLCLLDPNSESVEFLMRVDEQVTGKKGFIMRFAANVVDSFLIHFHTHKSGRSGCNRCVVSFLASALASYSSERGGFIKSRFICKLLNR